MTFLNKKKRVNITTKSIVIYKFEIISLVKYINIQNYEKFSL